MNPIISMAVKDLRLLFRDRMAAFFILGFPILMGVFFGMVMKQGSSDEKSKMPVAMIDLDQSDGSRDFAKQLAEQGDIQYTDLGSNSDGPSPSAEDLLATARDQVRRGKAVGFIVLPKGFGEAAGMMWQEQPEIQIGLDPSRSAEAAMLEGFLMKGMGEIVGKRFNDPLSMKSSIDKAKDDLKQDKTVSPLQKLAVSSMLGTLDSLFVNMDNVNQQAKTEADAAGKPNSGGTRDFQFANVKRVDILKPANTNGPKVKPTSGWDLSFPQAMLWGVMGCVAGFSISIARERTMGTMVRLQAAPLNTWQILAGKALACFTAVVFVLAFLTIFGMFLGMSPNSFGKLTAAGLCITVCFVGIMMTLSVIGKTEQSVAGIGWAINMVMAMLGGAMIPYMFMPPFLKKMGLFSPVKWGIEALEGAIWRQYSWSEMMLPCLVLLLIGVAGFTIGSIRLRKLLTVV